LLVDDALGRFYGVGVRTVSFDEDGTRRTVPTTRFR
jgi:hypothetical protein